MPSFIGDLAVKDLPFSTLFRNSPFIEKRSELSAFRWELPLGMSHSTPGELPSARSTQQGIVAHKKTVKVKRKLIILGKPNR